MSSAIKTNFIEPLMVLRQTIKPLKLSRWRVVQLFLKTIIDGLSTGVCTAFVAVALGLVLWLVLGARRRSHSRLPHDLPILKRNDAHFEDILKEARAKYPDTPVLIKNNRHQFVLYPQQCFDEIKKLPEHSASAAGFFHYSNYGNWTLIGTETNALLKGIMADLTRSLPARVFSRQQDVRTAFDSIIGGCPDNGKEFPLLITCFELVAQINACSFVGRELGCNRKWVRAVMMAPIFAHVAVTAMNELPRLLRPLLAPVLFAPAVKNQWDMRRLLTPYLKRDMAVFSSAKDKRELIKPDPEGDIPFTAILLSRYKAAEASIRQLVADYWLVSFDSTPSTTTAIYHMIIELAKCPGAVEILRKELEENMVDGKLPCTHLQELQRMDSFLRESFRLHPVSLFSLQRFLKKPVQLSIGPAIPPGNIIAIDAQGINRSPELWENPDKFDMDRFYRLRQQPGNESKFHLLTTGPDSPGWGDGIQACPGRFFATSTIKIAFAHLLLNYDIELVDPTKPIKMKPLVNGTWQPDDTTAVRFKSRSPVKA